jgi:hypothetical protein
MRAIYTFSLLVFLGLTFTSCSEDTGIENPAATNLSASSLPSASTPDASEPTVEAAGPAKGSIHVDSDNLCTTNRVDNYAIPGRTHYVWLRLAMPDVQRNRGTFNWSIAASSSSARSSEVGTLSFGPPCPGTNWQAAAFVVPLVEGKHQLTVTDLSGKVVGKDTYRAFYPRRRG